MLVIPGRVIPPLQNSRRSNNKNTPRQSVLPNSTLPKPRKSNNPRPQALPSSEGHAQTPGWLARGRREPLLAQRLRNSRPRVNHKLWCLLFKINNCFYLSLLYVCCCSSVSKIQFNLHLNSKALNECFDMQIFLALNQRMREHKRIAQRDLCNRKNYAIMTTAETGANEIIT